MTSKPGLIDEAVELLGGVEIFSSLTREERVTLARECELACAEPETTIFAVGSQARELCVVAAGSVVVRSSSGASRTSDIAKYVAGESFGELNLLRHAARDVAVVAETQVELLRFPRAGVDIDTLMTAHPALYARVVHRMLMLVGDRIRSTNRLISENSPWIQQLRTQVYVDKLTGAYNRAFLDEEVPTLLARAERYVVLMAKPDNFKAINDTFGHEVGDRAIELYADTLRANLPSGALLGRYMSNEMAIVVPGLDPARAEESSRALHQTLTAIDYGRLTDAEAPTITYCVGAIASGASAGDPADAVASAHEALFAARERGGNDIEVRHRW